jgi:DNA-binding beta-propeller fold protein YncE
VIDIAKARATNFSNDAIVGGMPSGYVNLPVISPDGRYLYLPNPTVSTTLNWPDVCKTADGKSPVPTGAILVMDLQRIGPDLMKSVVATVPAGCSTRRVAVTADGNTLYATATFDNMLWAFDVTPLKSGGTPLLKGKVPTGSSPIGIALIREGTQIVVANANFLPGTNEETNQADQTLTVIDTTRIGEGARAVLGTIPARSAPRNPTVTADGRTLFVNSQSHGLEIIDLERVKVEPVTK